MTKAKDPINVKLQLTEPPSDGNSKLLSNSFLQNRGFYIINSIILIHYLKQQIDFKNKLYVILEA